MISFTIATRNRPELFKQMCLSVLNNADNPNDIEFVAYRDNDDETIYEYVGNYKEVKGERIGVTAGTVECQKVATGPIYGYIPDDIMFETKGWDTQVKAAFDRYPDKIALVFMNEHRFRGSFCYLGFLHKNWIDTIGYLPTFNVLLGEKWINDIARMIDRYVYLHEVSFRDLRVEDENHTRILALGRRDRSRTKYHYPEMTKIRLEYAEKLREFIKNYK